MLQTDAQTVYAISRNGCGGRSRRTIWLRRRESNSRREGMGLAASPDARHIKKHRPGRTLEFIVLDGVLEGEPWLKAQDSNLYCPRIRQGSCR